MSMSSRVMRGAGAPSDPRFTPRWRPRQYPSCQSSPKTAAGVPTIRNALRFQSQAVTSPACGVRHPSPPPGTGPEESGRRRKTRPHEGGLGATLYGGTQVEEKPERGCGSRSAWGCETV
jgi:hypothetical protein